MDLLQQLATAQGAKGMSKYPGLKRRGSRGIYQLRLAIPRDLHAVFGRKEVTVSLRTSDSQKAVDRYFIKVGRLRAAFKDARAFKVLVQDLPPRWNPFKIFKGTALVDVAKKTRAWVCLGR
jgi:hypothetical protein